jgi:enediyne biosynthesis protein E4
VLSQSSFYSANDSRLHFGLGPAETADLEIRWPNGGNEKIPRVPANRLVVVREGSGVIRTDPFRKNPR